MTTRAIPRDFAAMEQRRKRAASMFKKGASQGDVARELGVSRQSASRWHAEWLRGGAVALRGAGRAGRLPRLDESDLKNVERRLLKGPTANGYPTDLWTLERVGEVIDDVTGVRYHPGHVWRVLRQLGWSRQRPARRALERNDEAIAHWAKHEWPRVKKRPAAKGLDLLPGREWVQPPPLG
jgi:transposase